MSFLIHSYHELADNFDFTENWDQFGVKTENIQEKVKNVLT